jgi:hypothetical protein
MICLYNRAATQKLAEFVRKHRIGKTVVIPYITKDAGVIVHALSFCGGPKRYAPPFSLGLCNGLSAAMTD